MFAGVVAPVARASAPSVFYVNSYFGRDGNTGLSPLAPFATLPRAQQAARGAAHPATVDVAGTFDLTTPLTFGPADSNVTWQATDPSRPPLISGGRVIAPTGTNRWTYNAALRVWSLVGVSKLATRDLWVNGHRASRVHSCVGDDPCGAHNQFVPSTLALTANGKSTAPDPSLPDYDESLAGRLHTYRNPSSIELVYRFDGEAGHTGSPWAEPRCGVASILVTKITMDRCFGVGRAENVGTPYQIDRPSEVENAFELFDPVALGNQWYWDPVTSTLSYQPTPTDPPGPPQSVVAGGLDGVLVNIDGARDLRFTQIDFGYTTWTDPSGPSGMIDEQTGIPMVACGPGCVTAAVPPAAITTAHASGLAFSHDGFVHLGAGGVALGIGVSHSAVTSSFFEDIGGTGVLVGTVVPSAVAVADSVSGNVFTGSGYAVGAQYRSSPAIWAGYARGLQVTDNRICPFSECALPNAGIAVGWGWNTAAAGVGDNTIASNQVANTMQWLWDGAPIYSLGVQPGELIRANVIRGARQAPGAIYVDQGGSAVTVLDNVVESVRYMRDPFLGQQDRASAAVFLHTCASGPVAVLDTFADSTPWVTVDNSRGGCPSPVVASLTMRGSFLGLPPVALPASLLDPDARGALLGAPSAVAAAADSALTQRVTWAPSSGAAGYEVDQTDPVYGTVVVGASASSPVVAASPTRQGSYTDVVLARDASGGLSPPSAPATVRP